MKSLRLASSLVRNSRKIPSTKNTLLKTKFSNLKRIELQHRDYSSEKQGSGIAHFPPYVYLQGTVHLLFLLMIFLFFVDKMCVLSTPSTVCDKSSVVKVDVPANFVEDAEWANNLRVQKAFRPLFSSGELNFYTISFVENPSNIDLKTHIDIKKSEFFSLHYRGSVVPLTISRLPFSLPENVTYECWQFNPGSLFTEFANVKAQICLFLETPGGFWQISWHASSSILISGSQNWLSFLKGILISPAPPDSIPGGELINNTDKPIPQSL